MLRAEIISLSQWLTPKTFRKGFFMFDREEVESIWPGIMTNMIHYALSTNLQGNDLRRFLRREGYLPTDLTWEDARYYWWQWCKEVEPLWKTLWNKAYPVDFFCSECQWYYFKHDSSCCENCSDKFRQCPRELSCSKCFSHGKPNLHGILLCTNHWKKYST